MLKISKSVWWWCITPRASSLQELLSELKKKKWRRMDEDLDISDITSLASSLLYEGGNKSRSWHKNLRKFKSLTSNFLPLGWGLVPCCSTPLHLGPNMVRCLSWCGQIWRKGQFFSPAMAVFQPIGSLLYMAGACWSYCYCLLVRCPPHDDDDNADGDIGENHDDTPRRWSW